MTPAAPVASNPVLRRVLTVAGIVTAVLAVAGAVIGFAVSGTSGLFSALVGVVLAALFLGITGASILIANRWNGDPLYPTLFFSIVLGGWVIKFVIFIVALFLLRGAPWLDSMVFFIALVVSILATLVVDVIVMMKMRIPYVSDADLPTSFDDEEEATQPAAGEDTPAAREESSRNAEKPLDRA
ncbi:MULTISPECIES: hypothetical protein [Microbacterium]|uniref:hypothetical protein n=1 Tax=Microbacterium TaxID=33882 RepID=UPI001E35FE25|nr:hypothetical protein [Microbacterium nymphoidis]MCD2499845.1 hypothetical protein [Microbacterium nymphoidis]